VTAGGSIVCGTGAFASVASERSVSVTVAHYTDALHGFAPCPGSPNGAYITGANKGVMILNLLGGDKIAGDGVNAKPATVIHDVFQLANQGTQPVCVWLNVDPKTNGDGKDAVSFYPNHDRSASLVGSDNVTCLDVGDSVCVGIDVETYGLNGGDSLMCPVRDGA
jgi:hypothetical protein